MGLDLGTTSIGWAFIHENDLQPKVRLGVRITPLTSDERDKFNKGQTISTNQDRTLKRGARKTLDRYQLRRKKLVKLAVMHGLATENDILKNKEQGIEAWELRAKAAKQRVSLDELVRVLLHINTKRGFKSNRKADSKEEAGDYIKSISERDNAVLENHYTIGQWYWQQIVESQKAKQPLPKFKQLVFSRALHKAEFDKIWETQAVYYPQLTEGLKKQMGDYTIFYQRRLKSQKKRISRCRFMPNVRVIPVSHPLFELFRIWHDVNNLEVSFGAKKEKLQLDVSIKQALVDALWNSADKNPTKAKTKMTAKEIQKFLSDHLRHTPAQYHLNFEELKGAVTMNEMRVRFAQAGIKRPDLLEFDPFLEGQAFDKQPVLRLWHDLYSIEDNDDLISGLMRHFDFTHDQAEVVASLGFPAKHGALSARAIRKILPHLMDGLTYDKACLLANFKHSDSETKVEKNERVLQDSLVPVNRNSLRNPVVEKILNQMVNVVNAILESPDLGRPDEIRLEMGREISATAKQRERMTKAINDNKKEHERIAEQLKALGIKKYNRNDIIKYKLGEECNWVSIYTGKGISREQVFGLNSQYDVDHIIPQSRLFDDSQSNKVLVEASINREKGNQTAYDYMASKGEAALEAYISRVKELQAKDKRKRSKVDKLLMKGDNLPNDFINRQLGETQYIAAEAFKRLKSVCREVVPTVGSITAHLRHEWGLDELIRDLNIAKYEAIGQVKMEEGKDGRLRKKIEDWSKRDDHRHHALDAFVVACTSRSMVQRLNNLNQLKTEQEMALKDASAYGLAKRLRQFEPPYTRLRELVKDALQDVLVSYKTGKRVAVWSRSVIKLPDGSKQVRKILIPRGQLHLETVYGKNRRYVKEPILLKSINTAEQIRDPEAAKLWQDRVNKAGGDPKKAFSAGELKKAAFAVNGKVYEALSCWEDRYVQRIELSEKTKIEDIVDEGIKRLVRERVEEAGMAALQKGNLDEQPLWQNENARIPIHRVRVFDRASELLPLRNNEKGEPKDYVYTRNNHHISLYQKADAAYHLEITSFMEAVVRRQNQEPVIVLNHPEGHRFVASFQQNEYFLFAERNQDLDLSLDEISARLFRVQKLSLNSSGGPYIVFRHHLETDINREAHFAFRRITSVPNLPSHKVRLDALGQIVEAETLAY